MPLSKKMSADDRLDVMELIGRYQHSEDAGNVEAYASTFTPDGVVEWPRGILNGRTEIADWYRSLMPAGIGATPARMRHFVSLPYIYDGDGQQCSVRTYLVLFAYDESGNVVSGSTWTYIDTCVKTEDGWLFVKRYMQPDMGGIAERPKP